ncbi:indolepyruvate oxidoreductase subunit beta [candidate division CSSED10-310 bacterium]|uniref:Indolepyruvate oxidoreductase subunit beta n=1 Tax=candidate division CSSED10-310 bacterium TaxID=2855610 RepID=A0ABV6Z646_UNCC1
MKPVKIFLIGVGGQGSILASRILSEAALKMGIAVVMSEVHGMAQRGGIVETAVILGGLKSPLIRKGDADVLIAFEPNEALRALPYCSAGATVFINTRPIIPAMVSLGKAPYLEPDNVIAVISQSVGEIKAFDATALAEKAGTAKATNIVMLGALIGSDLLPITTDILKEVVSQFVPQKTLQMNLRAFELGINAGWLIKNNSSCKNESGSFST